MANGPENDPLGAKKGLFVTNGPKKKPLATVAAKNPCRHKKESSTSVLPSVVPAGLEPATHGL